MDSLPSINISFNIGGKNLPFDEITNALGFEPTKVWVQNKPHLADLLEIENSCWTFELRDQLSESTDEVIIRLLEKIWIYRDNIQHYLDAKEYTASIVVNVTFHNKRPLYDLSIKTMKMLAFLRCDFNMDIFDYS